MRDKKEIHCRVDAIETCHVVNLLLQVSGIGRHCMSNSKIEFQQSKLNHNYSIKLIYCPILIDI